MKIYTKWMTFFFLTALLAGCGEDGAAPEAANTPECEVDACDGDTVLNKCNDGKIEKIDCSEDNDQICTNNACAPKPVDPKPECTANACDGDTVLNKCNDGKIEKIDCSKDNDQICANNACAPKPVDPDPECTADACDTDGVTLLKCSDGAVERIDCSKDNDQICANNACAPKSVDPDPECTADACDTDGVTLLKCNDGAVERIDCSKDNDQICANDACAPKPVEPECDPQSEATCDGNTLVSCTPEGKNSRINCEDEHKVCDSDAHECIAPVADGGIGAPCTCSGDSCNTVITGNEINDTLSSTVKFLAASFAGTDSMTVPNFFGNTDQIKGCEALASAVPEGMALGCFRDSSLSATPGFIATAKKIMNYVKSLKKDELANYGLNVIEKMEESIALSVPKGYCFVGALDAHVVFTTSGSLIKTALSNAGANFVALADNKFDTGDVEKAKTATCPEGSVLINDIYKTTTIAGYGKNGNDVTSFSMAMCLKSCTEDSDCRTDHGYSCVDWHEKKVCFYAQTIEAIHALEASLKVE